MCLRKTYVDNSIELDQAVKFCFRSGCKGFRSGCTDLDQVVTKFRSSCKDVFKSSCTDFRSGCKDFLWSLITVTLFLGGWKLPGTLYRALEDVSAFRTLAFLEVSWVLLKTTVLMVLVSLLLWKHFLEVVLVLLLKH
jgi:hypothetical protein